MAEVKYVADIWDTSNLYDPESGECLNDETMQAIRDVEAGKVNRCKDMNELLALYRECHISPD